MNLRVAKRQDERACEQTEPKRQRWRSRLCESSPMGFYGGDTNLYRYVGNGPTDATDPSGLIKKSKQDFWDTTSGKGFWEDIEKAAQEAKARAKLLIEAAKKIDPVIRRDNAGEIDAFIKRMQYIIDNVDSLTISVDFSPSDRQAMPLGGRDRRVRFYLFSMYNIMDETGKKPYSAGKGNEKKVLTLPLPGYMGMSDDDLKACNKNFFDQMAINEKDRVEDKLPKPKIVRWNTGQIAALLANELMHFYEDDGKGAYSIGGTVKKQDRIFFRDGTRAADFHLSLPESNWYADLNSASQIMQGIYYKKIFWEPLKPKKE